MDSIAYGFVPARGGSQGIPGKNLKALAGRPLVARAIATLRAVPGLASVLLSTDAEDIAGVGRAAGAEVPFLRPAPLATASARVTDAVAHAVAFLDHQGRRVDWLVMLQPTSPFVRAETVAAVLAQARSQDAALVQTVSPVKDHPYWVRVPAGNRMVPFHHVFGSLRRQDLPRLLVLNGAVNVYRAEAVRSGALPALPGYFVIDRIEGFDIDDDDDWFLAECIAAALEGGPAGTGRGAPCSG